MATSLNELPAVDPDSGRVNVVIDTPKGSRNKYKFGEHHGQWMKSSNFFVSYNQIEGRQFKPLARRAADRARELLDEATGGASSGANGAQRSRGRNTK